MAMYLGQKDVEARVVEWIRDSFKFLLDEVYVISKNTSTVEHNREATRLLKRVKDAWTTVCLPSLTRSREPSVVLFPFFSRSLSFERCAMYAKF
jgi:hypothetical protein